MNKKSIIWLVVVMLFAGMLLTGCGADNGIKGKWVFEDYEGTFQEGTLLYLWKYYNNHYGKFHLYLDGNGSGNWYTAGKYEDEVHQFTYTLEDGLLKYEGKDGTASVHFEIKDGKLILTGDVKGPSGPTGEVSILTFVKDK